MLKQDFGCSTEEGIYLHTRSDAGMYNLSRLKAKTKVTNTVIRDILFDDAEALVAHAEEELQSMMDKISCACTAFGLTISIKKTNMMPQGIDSQPEIKIGENRTSVSQCRMTSPVTKS